jgi:hypothetical protein
MKKHEASGVHSQSKSTDLLDNATPQTPERFDALSTLFDRAGARAKGFRLLPGTPHNARAARPRLPTPRPVASTDLHGPGARSQLGGGFTCCDIPF